MGPAADRYRTRAGDIMDQAGRLLATVDDLDTAARIETSRLGATTGQADVTAMLERLGESYRKVASQRGAELDLTIVAGLPEAAVAPDVAERLLARMLAATIGLTREGELIAAELSRAAGGDRDMLLFAIDRPGAVAGLSEEALLDPRFMPAGDWPAAPSLGLGFALRLIRNLAEAAGGELTIDPERIRLYLPTITGA